MSLEHLPPDIEHGIRAYAASLRISHDEAVIKLLESGLTAERSVPDLGFGHRRGPRKPNLEVAERLPIIGMFPNDPEFDRTMDGIIAGRGKRYSDD